ncbi:NAD(P)-binding protein [Massilia aerilata]|uniref:NAD(P)-binding protein n=1 Tax=Massilia aerilata TaxID=453817 RepID=A0ABW0S6B6_9BURK
MAQLQKIAVLGGGAGSLAAAFYLSAQPGWRERYEITVYQQGWRLGGKGASGRNAAQAQRIEEHGLHIWFGFYANAFAMLRAAYQELGRPLDAPLARWDQAFQPHDYVVLAEQVGSDWRPWHLVLPRRPGEPGAGSEPVSPWRMALEGIKWLRQWHSELQPTARAPTGIFGDPFTELQDQASTLPLDAHLHTGADHARLLATLGRAEVQLRTTQAALIDDDRTRRTLVGLHIGITLLRGMLADGVFTRGFDPINREDLRAWLRRHGGDPALCVDSAPVNAMYAQLFAFEDGDPARPNLEAGVALRWMMRMSFAYRGALMYRMQAGMGDAVFAPLYEVLARRGVRFAFFHRVEEITAAEGSVDAVRMSVQADVTGGDYRPLVQVEGLPCWPDLPDYGQLDPAQAALLQEHAVDLESWWSDWPRLYREAFGKDLPQRVLRRGRDFDHVVLGLPVATLPLVAPALLAASPPLASTSAALRTVVTQACQVWLNRNTQALGWTYLPNGEEPILTGFSQPCDTWAAMSQVLPAEDWPPAIAPKSAHYFCGAMALAEIPPQSDTGFPARAAAQAKANAVELLNDRIGALWKEAGSGFPWQWLVDPLEAEGPARMDRQYWRANVDPSERYVLSVAGSSAHRLASEGTGLENLFLAGDWLRTGLDSGCVEAAVMGGMQAARAIGGFPAEILGDNDAD